MDFIKENLLIIGISILALILLVVAIKLFIELKHSRNKHAKALNSLKRTAADALKKRSREAGKTMADLRWHNDKYNDKHHEVIVMKKVLAEIISKLHQYALYGFICFLICIFAFKIQVSVIFQSITNLSTFQNIFFAYTAISTILLLPLIAILAIGQKYFCFFDSDNCFASIPNLIFVNLSEDIMAPYYLVRMLFDKGNPVPLPLRIFNLITFIAILIFIIFGFLSCL